MGKCRRLSLNMVCRPTRGRKSKKMAERKRRKQKRRENGGLSPLETPFRRGQRKDGSLASRKKGHVWGKVKRAEKNLVWK